jgi:RNA polymerase sigma factor (sigma-70 family)
MTSNGATGRRPEQDRAFLDLITAVEGELHGCIQRRVRSVHTTQNIVQQTFLLAWGSASFDPERADAGAWLFTTARRLAKDWLESAESKSFSLEDLSVRMRGDGSYGSRSAQLVDRRTRDPLINLIEEERNRNLDAALARLPEDQRDILERYYLRQEGTQAEIAQAMGRISLAAFNSRLNRARKALTHEILMLRRPDGKDGGRL